MINIAQTRSSLELSPVLQIRFALVERHGVALVHLDKNPTEEEDERGTKIAATKRLLCSRF